MRVQGKTLAMGMAGVLCLGGLGLTAGSLVFNADGSLGAGEVNAQLSCTDEVDIQPGVASYDPNDETFEYTSATVTGDLSGCLGVSAVVSVIADNAVISTNATPYQVTAADVTADEFSVTIDTGVAANRNPASTSWGIVLDAVEPQGAVTNLAGSVGSGYVNLTWDAPTNVGNDAIWGYKVEYAPDDGGAPGVWSTSISNTTSQATAYTVSGLTNGTFYWFRVTPIGHRGTGILSTTSGSSYKPFGTPFAPASVTPSDGAAGTVNLTWAAAANNGDDITGYQIRYYSYNTSSYTTFNANTGTTATSIAVTGLTSDTNYFFTVAGINSAGVGSARTSVVVSAP